MSQRSSFLALIVLGALRIPAPASTNAELLQEMCQADDRVEAALAANDASHLKSTDSQSSAFCEGFIMGWAQTVNGMGIVGENADLSTFFFPDDFNFQQAKKVFLKYVADHPECLSKRAAFVLTAALSEKNVLQKKILPLGKAGVEAAPVPNKK